MGSFTIAAMLARPLTGWAADAYGRYALLVGGTVLSVAAILGHVWVAGVGLLLVLRFVHGISFGVATTAAGTTAADLVPRQRLGEGMGFFTLAMSLPLAVAPAVGLALAGREEYTALFLAAGALTAASLAVVAFLRAPSPERVRGLDGAGPRFTMGALFERAALFPSVIMVALNVTYGPVLTFIGLYGEERGIAHVGVFFTVYAVVLTIVRPVAGRLADRLGYERAAAAGLVLVVVSLVVLAWTGSLWGVLAAAVLYGAGFGTAQPSLQAMAVFGVPSTRRGAATAMYYTAFDLGIAIGSVLGGVLADALSLRAVYVFCIVPASLGLVLVGGRLRARRGRLVVEGG